MIELFRKEDFSRRLAALRMNIGISARDMSLSLGQGAGYINNIENGHNLPSMGAFFEMCEFLNVTPEQFFALHDPDPAETAELLIGVQRLPKQQREILKKLIDML